MLKPILQATSLGIALMLGSAPAQANTYPDRAITVVVPFLAGGGGDTLARLATNALVKELGQSIVVENRPGAGGNIGTAQAARAEPNGYTLAYGTNGTMGTNHALYTRPGFSVDDFDPIALFGKISLVFTVRQESPFQSVDDVVAYARDNPDMLTCASGGNGTTSHLACAMFQKLAGIQVQHVPYRSGSAAVVDMMSDRISFLIDVMPYLTPMIHDGKLRALAVTMTDRVPALPNVPTMREAGLKDYDLFAWDGLFAPAGTPVDRLDRLHAAVEEVLNDAEFRKVMTDRGTILEPMSRAAFAEFVAKEHQRMGALAGDLGIKVD